LSAVSTSRAPQHDGNRDVPHLATQTRVRGQNVEVGMRRLTHLVILAVSVLVGWLPLLVVPQATGQIIVRSAGSARGGTSLISTRSIDEYASLLSLSPEQHETVKTLHDGYRAAWKTADEERESTSESAQEKMQDGDFEGMNKAILEAMNTFADKAVAVEKQFMDNVKAVLSPEQLDKWPAVERHRRRDTRLRTTAFSGANLDLIRIVQRTRTDPGTPEFAQVLSDYEMALDRQLIEGANRVQTVPKPAENTMFDPKHQEALMKVVGENGLALRELHRDYAARLARMMSDEQRATFEQAISRRAFPEVYDITHVEQCLSAAAAFDDVPADGKTQISQLLQQWHREAASLNRAWAQAISKAEEQAGGTMPLRMQQWNGGGMDADVKAARDARRDLEKRLRTRLDEVLTTAQEERLPARKKSDAGPMTGGLRINLGGATDETDE
jgi:hypothetical protein